MDNKLISNRQEYIIDLFKHILEMEIDESYFKFFKDDEAVFFNFRSKSLYLCYDDYKKQYQIYHLNTMANPKQATKYHLQHWDYTLGSIFSYLSSMHSPSDMNKSHKKSKMDKLFDKIK